MYINGWNKIFSITRTTKANISGSKSLHSQAPVFAVTLFALSIFRVTSYYSKVWAFKQKKSFLGDFSKQLFIYFRIPQALDKSSILKVSLYLKAHPYFKSRRKLFRSSFFFKRFQRDFNQFSFSWKKHESSSNFQGNIYFILTSNSLKRYNLIEIFVMLSMFAIDFFCPFYI